MLEACRASTLSHPAALSGPGRRRRGSRMPKVRAQATAGKATTEVAASVIPVSPA